MFFLDDYSNAFEIQFAKKKYLICTATAREKLEWLHALKEQIMNIHQKDNLREAKGSQVKERAVSSSTPSVVSTASTPTVGSPAANLQAIFNNTPNRTNSTPTPEKTPTATSPTTPLRVSTPGTGGGKKIYLFFLLFICSNFDFYLFLNIS